MQEAQESDFSSETFSPNNCKVEPNRRTILHPALTQHVVVMGLQVVRVELT